MTAAYSLDEFGHLRPPAEGCAICGILPRDHGTRWTEHVGWHVYAAPPAELIEARLRARHEAKETT